MSRYKTSSGFGTFLVVIAVVVVVGILSIWTTMIGLGILHTYYPQIKASSFWESAMISLGIWLVIGGRGSVSPSKKD